MDLGTWILPQPRGTLRIRNSRPAKQAAVGADRGITKRASRSDQISAAESQIQYYRSRLTQNP